MHSPEMKIRNAAAAYGSVAAEGLHPSKKSQKRVQQYVDGKITKKELRSQTVRELRAHYARKHDKPI